jgi:hypothetical protein
MRKKVLSWTRGVLTEEKELARLIQEWQQDQTDGMFTEEDARTFVELQKIALLIVGYLSDPETWSKNTLSDNTYPSVAVVANAPQGNFGTFNNISWVFQPHPATRDFNRGVISTCELHYSSDLPMFGNTMDSGHPWPRLSIRIRPGLVTPGSNKAMQAEVIKQIEQIATERIHKAPVLTKSDSDKVREFLQETQLDQQAILNLIGHPQKAVREAALTLVGDSRGNIRNTVVDSPEAQAVRSRRTTDTNKTTNKR